MLEQTYKIAELDLNGDPDVSTLLEDSDFMAFVQDTFNQMAKNLNRSLNKLSL